MNQPQIEELLCQALETEMGGIQLYEAAISLAQNKELRKEWERYLAESRHHEEVLRDVMGKLGIGVDTETAGRAIVRNTGRALLEMMEAARPIGGAQAQIVAAEAITHAELKDHLNWSLIGKVAQQAKGREAELLKSAYDAIEDQEDRHFYHNKGWSRELWAASLGIPCVLPPPEEKLDVTSAFGAATAEQSRRLM